MAHEDLQRLALRLGVVGAMTSQAKETAGRLATGADEYERAILKRTNALSRQIRREGVGKNPKLEQEYCQLLMQRRRMLQAYELSKKDSQREPDIQASKSLKKALRPVPYETAPTLYLIAHCQTSHNAGTDQVTGWEDIPLNDNGRRAARELAVSLSSAGIEAIATSDLQRAVETATILHEVLCVPVAAPQSGFRPWDLGIFQGVSEKDAGPLIRPYVEDKPGVAIPGGECFDIYHERFMTSLTPLLILVGRGIRHTIGIVTHSKNLLLVDSWLHSGGGLGDLNLSRFLGHDVKPGTVLRLTMTPEGWEGTLFPPVEESRAAGLVITAQPADMTLVKARAGKKPQPGQLGFQFDEEKHPREQAGQNHGKYRGGEFVPKENAAAAWAKNLDIPVEERDYDPEGARPFAEYKPEKQRIYINREWKEHFTKYQRYGVPFGEAVLTHEKMHHLWHVAVGHSREGGNPEWKAAMQALEKVPHSGMVDEHPKGNLLERAVETLAVDTINPDLLSPAEHEWAQGIKEQAYANRNRLTLWRQGSPVGRSGAGTFYALDPARIGEGRTEPKSYEKTFQNLLTVPKDAHEPFAGNPSGTLRRQWLPHLDANKVFAQHGKKLGHKSAVDTSDWLVAHAAHERGHDGILYEGLEVQSLLDGFKPNPLFEKLNKKETLDPRKDWEENGVRSQSFKTWFGDWENNPAMASKVVNEDGSPQETHPIPVYHGTVHDFTAFDEEKLAGTTGHPTARLGFFFSASRDIARTFAGERLKYEAEKDIRTLARENYGQDYYTLTDEEKRANVRRLEKEQPKVVKPDPFNEQPEGSRVITAYLNLRNPHTLTTDEWDERFAKPWLDRDRRSEVREAVTAFKADLLAKGHDGIILEASPHMKDRPLNEYAARSYVVFKPEQIKAADNEGTFDQTNPDIRKSFREVDRQDAGWSGTWTFYEPIEKAVEPEPFVPPDMPRWQIRPTGDEQRYLPLNGIEDREKLREMVATMKSGNWTWDNPIIHSGDQLLTGSHRYHAAKEAGLTIPLKDFGEVCAEGGVDFEKEWRAQAEPWGGWISNVSNVIRLLPAGLAKKYGIELG